MVFLAGFVQNTPLPRTSKKYRQKICYASPSTFCRIFIDVCLSIFERILVLVRKFFNCLRWFTMSILLILASFTEAAPLLSFLQNLSDMGAAMKNVLSESMLNKAMYSRLFESKSSVSVYGFYPNPLILVCRYANDRAAFLSRSASYYSDVLKSMDSIATQDDADALGMGFSILPCFWLQ